MAIGWPSNISQTNKNGHIQFINIHTHQPTGSPDCLEIENLRYGQTKSGQAKYCSIGLHPWFLPEQPLSTTQLWLQGNASNDQVVAIGEAGLDKLVETPWDLQLAAFQACIETAETVEKPLIIHCVRAFEEILALKKQWKPKQPWIFHGFDKNPQTATMLLHAGCYLSFGAALFKDKSRAKAALQQISPKRYFLETDDADMSIHAVYQQAAKLLEVNPDAVQQQLSQNFMVVFAHAHPS